MGASVLLASALATVGSLAGAIVARIRCLCKPDERDRCKCMSACSDQPLLAKPDDELLIHQYHLGGKEILVATSKE